VNDSEPNSPWKGDVWSFTIPPRNAYDISPLDGTKFVDPNVEFSWTGGLGAILHHVYFGDNFDDVNDGAADTYKGALTDPTYPPPGSPSYQLRILILSAGGLLRRPKAVKF